MDYMLTVRRVRGGAFIAEPGPAKYLALPEDTTQPRPDHATPRRAWLDAVLRDAAGGGQGADREGDILFYVHGFNTPQATVLARHRLIRRALGRQGYTGAVVSFDWPAARMITDVSLNSTLPGCPTLRPASGTGVRRMGGCPRPGRGTR